MNLLPKHLGGHKNITHVDHGSLKFFIENFGIKSFIDIGCGVGGQLEVASELELEIQGIDGDFTVQRNVPCIIHDFTKGICKLPKENYDLGWSVEFVEHVDKKYINNYLDVFQKCNYLIMTHAPPNKPGHHHINCQNSNYWIDILSKIGMVYSEELTKKIKQNSTMKREFIQNNGLVFKNKKSVNSSNEN